MNGLLDTVRGAEQHRHNSEFDVLRLGDDHDWQFGEFPADPLDEFDSIRVRNAQIREHGLITCAGSEQTQGSFRRWTWDYVQTLGHGIFVAGDGNIPHQKKR